MLTTLLPFFTFLAIGLVIAMLGRLMIAGGRSRRAEDVGRRTVNFVFGPLTPALAALLPRGEKLTATVEQELKQAGYYHPLASKQFFAVRNTLVIGWVILIGSAVVAATSPSNDPSLQILVAGSIIALMLYSVPRLYLQSLAARRLRNILIGLPDALDMITMCMTGGLSLQQSLQRVSNELRTSHTDLALELEIIQRHSAAHTLEYALSKFSQRIDNPEIKSLTALVSQAEQLGTNVATALRDYADGIRRAHRQRAEEKGNKASVKMLLPVALCLAPPVYILLLAPAMLELRDFLIRENRPGGVLAPVEPGGNRSRLPGLQQSLNNAAGE